MRKKSKYLIALSLLIMAIPAIGAFAQTESGYNREVRTNTWSIYTQGGLSWATDVWYPSINAKRSYGLSPAVGGGVDYNIRPWVRVGVEYLYSNYRREQRFSTLDTKVMPIKAYGNYLMNYHNVKLNAGFNIMEIWDSRKAQWLNIYAGTGAGYMLAKGNEYGIYFSSSQTLDGNAVPAGGTNVSVDNSSTITISTTYTDNVRATNHHSSFNKVFIPTSLNVEADLSRHFTVGLKGEVDWIMNRKDVAPKNLIFALATVRYNIGTTRGFKKPKEYIAEIEMLNNKVNELKSDAEREAARADKAEKDVKRLGEANSDLKRQLEECEDCAELCESKLEQSEKQVFVVPFENCSSKIDGTEQARLKQCAQTVKGRQLSLLAEASSPGTKDGNQRLSERRLESVMNILLAEGIEKENLKPRYAIGDQNGIATSEGRRVTITVE